MVSKRSLGFNRTRTLSGLLQTREGSFQMLRHIGFFAQQMIGHAVKCAGEAFFEFSLGQAGRLRQFKTWEAQAIFEQDDVTYEEHPQLRLPSDDSASQGKILCP